MVELWYKLPIGMLHCFTSAKNSKKTPQSLMYLTKKSNFEKLKIKVARF